MEIQNKKCSSKKHSEIDAESFCLECNKYLCDKCLNFHSELFDNHQICKLDKNVEDFFSGFCKEKGHNNKLEYYCLDHNQLCCANCLCKISDGKNGQHKNCKVCPLDQIKDEKRKKLKENISCLEKISRLYNNEKINKEKIKVQNIFTKIRSSLNDREEKLLSDIDNIFNEDKISEELSNKIETNLEKGKKINEDWNENKLSLLINDCINIEKSMKEFNLVNENVNMDNEFKYKKEELNSILKSIDSFGEITNNKNLEKKIDNLFLELEYEYNLSSIFEKDDIIKQIKKFNCDKQKMKGWIKERL
jgi:hypothetical protein